MIEMRWFDRKTPSQFRVTAHFDGIVIPPEDRIERVLQYRMLSDAHQGNGSEIITTFTPWHDIPVVKEV